MPTTEVFPIKLARTPTIGIKAAHLENVLTVTRTLFFSLSFVIITMTGDFSFQIILQKSTMVCDKGP